MLMLYANKILKEIYGENEVYLSTDSLERIIIDKSCIETVATTLNPDFPIVLYVKLNKTGYRIELKPNKNFDDIAGFFEYIRDYNDIDFETEEIPIKGEIKDGNIYHNSGKYLLILSSDTDYTYGIIQRGVILEFVAVEKKELTKHWLWKYIGNIENDAFNINIALNNFKEFVEEKEKEK